MTTRLKFLCETVTVGPKDPKTSRQAYSAVLHPVTTGSEENNRFFAATPSGTLKVDGVIHGDDALVQGQTYFLDLTPA